MTKEQILLIYKECKSMKKTAKKAGVSAITIKKVLVDQGLFSTKISQEVQSLYKQGFSIREIMNKTGLSRSSVHSYLPYIKGLYNSDNPTQNALNVRMCRKKKLLK